MALKRPKEVHWNFTQPPEPYPPTPSRICFLGPSGSGKTTTLIAMLLGPYKKIYEGLHVFSPSVQIDSAWDPVKEFVKNLKHSGFHQEWDEKALVTILDDQRAKIKEQKDAKTTKPLSQILVIIDDFADRHDVMHNSGNVLTSLMIRGRHFGVSTWVSTQKLTAVSLVARVNFQSLLCWRLRNQKELDCLTDELSAIFDKVLLAMYKAATDEPYSFWYILLTAKHKEDMFFLRFDKKITVVDPDAEEA
jgi:SpoVK/Ycf46/Vps4 family AAA+-type ATPase